MLTAQEYIEIAKNTIENGGDSVRATDGSRPDHGYAVGGACRGLAVPGCDGLTVEGLADKIREYCDDVIYDVVEKYGAAGLDAGSIVLGTWVDDAAGFVDIDVSNVIENYSEAMSLAAGRGEVAIYNLKAGRAIYVAEHAAALGF